MKILVTGRGTSGSFRVRGEQLGAAIGASVIPKALDVGGYDAAVLVKRTENDLLQRLRRAGVPIVWDVVDAYPQPQGNTWTREECMAWLRAEVQRIQPVGIVAATRAMAADCEEFGVPVLALPHHARPGLAKNPVRAVVETVGYEGAEHYLGRWRRILEAECLRRGWRFVVNPPALADLDIVVALRDVDGYAPRHWKSGVKLSNAQGSGTPFIGCREAGYREQAVGTAEKWVDTEAELARALDALSPYRERVRASGWMLAAAPRLDGVAATYRRWIEETVCATAGR